ncbi:MAG: DUF3226 domain-containing protein [bacterium]
MPIIEAIQLLVEGKDAEIFFKALLRKINLSGIQVQDFGGKDELKGFLKALRNAPNFARQVVSLGIVRDAETDPKAAFQSVCSALRNADLTEPPRPIAQAGENPKISVLIIPNAMTPGMLETLCLEAVTEDPAMACVREYFECVQLKKGLLPSNMFKARLHVYLASCSKPGLRLGEAADAGYWPWDNPIFDPLKQFLYAL